ncbi:hypothetical protein BJX61DRAFT_539288 [Aspergillus egyptiacus]|nr:hypothetical protein BJX61DRAFT_539288 [Aspergillus egyptiacus]
MSKAMQEIPSHAAGPATNFHDSAGTERLQRKPIPRRAALACGQCRLRKVRCDVAYKTGSCTNCLLDGVECKILTPRRRPSRKTGNEHIFGPLQPASVPRNIYQPDILERGCMQSIQSPRAMGDAGHCESSMQIANYRGQRESPWPSITINVDNFQRAPFGPWFLNEKQRREMYLPGFIKPLHVQNAADLAILQQRSIFTLLPRLQQVVLKTYEEFLHPLVPIVDLAQFRNAINGGSSEVRISLLLYHAVMFAGLSVVDGGIIQRLSHTTKLVAREMAYEKAKVLVDLEVEKDQAVLCQASILLAHRTTHFNARACNIWSGNAISYAHNMKLYRTDLTSWNSSEPNRRRILWWTVLMQECDVCMYTGQPPRVWPQDTPMLSLRDFGMEEGSPLQGPAVKIAMVCILKAKLSNRIYQIMRSWYEDIQPWRGKQSRTPLPALKQYMTQQLVSWYAELPPELRWENIRQCARSADQPGVTFGMAMVELTYWSAHLLMHKDNMSLAVGENESRVEDVTDYTVRNDSKRPCLRHSATRILGVATTLLAANISFCLNVGALAKVVLATTVFLQDLKSSDPTLRRSSLRKLSVSCGVMRTLADTIPLLAEYAEQIRQYAERLASDSPGERLYLMDSGSGASSNVAELEEEEGETDAQQPWEVPFAQLPDKDSLVVNDLTLYHNGFGLL